MLVDQAASQIGGTGVTPVKSGVSLDFVNDPSRKVGRTPQGKSKPTAGCGRDALNNRPEAGATHGL
jgi:hypothetical protein